MLEKRAVEIARIRVPVKRRKTLDPAKAAALAESILEEGQKTPISVRADGDGFVLVEGLHRLEACRSLGEATILGTVVRAKLR
jgi:ParB-like chromosome segregation protein Spo0J